MPDFIELFTNLDYAKTFLVSIQWYWVLMFAFLVTFIENIFPPSPSDFILVFMGSLITLGNVNFISLLLCSTLGSFLGFLVMFYIGKFFGDKIIDSNKIKFINKESLIKPMQWFQKYGYYLIVVNRFLSGTRAVISFIAGMSHLSIPKTIILSTISAALWNCVLIFLGVSFSNNLDVIINYVTLYGKIIFPILILIIIFFVIKYIIKIKKIKLN